MNPQLLIKIMSAPEKKSVANDAGVTVGEQNDLEVSRDVESQPEKIKGHGEPVVQLTRWRLFWVMVG